MYSTELADGCVVNIKEIEKNKEVLYGFVPDLLHV